MSVAAAVSGHHTEGASEQSDMTLPSAANKCPRKEESERPGVSAATTNGRHSREGVSEKACADVNFLASDRRCSIEVVIVDRPDNCPVPESTASSK